MSRFYSSASRVAAFSTLAVVSVSAYAHTPFLLPSSFETSTRSATINVDASTSHSFAPDIAYGNHPFSVTGPDGKTLAIPAENVLQSGARTVVGYKLTDAQPGSYRVTAGPRAANPRRSYVDSEGNRLNIQNNEVPAGAVLKSHTQSVALMHAYIRVGSDAEATQVAKPTGKGLELVPISHPNRLAQGGKFDFAVHYNGKPLADHSVSLMYSNMDFSGRSESESVKADGRGRVSYALAKPGVYMASVHYAEDGPVRDDKPNMSYSTSLTFNVISAEHAEAAKAAAERARARAQEQAAGGGQQGGQQGGAAAGGGQRGQAPAAAGGGQRGQAPAAGGGQQRQPQAQGGQQGRGGQDQAGARGGRGDGAGQGGGGRAPEGRAADGGGRGQGQQGGGRGEGGGRQGGEGGGRGGEGGGRPARQ